MKCLLGWCVDSNSNGNFKVEGRNPFSVEEMTLHCQSVFDILRTPDAIKDLSLPPIEALTASLDVIMSRIMFKFYVLKEKENRQDSHTERGVEKIYSTCFIYYKHSDIKLRKHFSTACFIHEVANAMRWEMIRTRDLSVQIDFQLTSCPKLRAAERIFNDNVIFMRDDDKFYAGYWVEHKLLGGVWCMLDGCYLNENSERIETPQGGMWMKVVKSTGREESRDGYRFTELEGFDELNQAKTISFCFRDYSSRYLYSYVTRCRSRRIELS